MSNERVPSKIFDADGPIAKCLDAYEVRPQQVRMAEAVTGAIADRGALLVEAGTGVGKSLAYLVPFVNWAFSEEKRVVVSTYTKALQAQLYVKDLPFIERALGIPFRYAICMGSDNYVCLRKADRNAQFELFSTKRAAAQAEKILKWISATPTGLRTDLDIEPDAAVWEKFSRDPGMCMGRKCRRAGECFYLKARQEQAKAHVLVTNHSLLFTDMMSEAKLLPEFHGLVLDEAHTLEDVATDHFGREISSGGFRRMIEGVVSLLAAVKARVGSGKPELEIVSEAGKYAKALSAAGEAFFAGAAETFGKEERVIELEGSDYLPDDISQEAESLTLVLADLAKSMAEGEERELARSMASKCGEFASSLDFVLYRERLPEYVYWAEVKPSKGGALYAFHAAPVNISEELREHLFDVISPVVLTSATLAASSGAGKPDFSFIKKRLGIGPCRELVLDSPFDYKKNVLLYIPKGIHDPNSALAEYKKEVKKNLLDLYDILGGRMFALFTSYDMLNSVSELIARERPDVEMLRQGDLPRYVLLDVFKKSGTSILMGTATFWQGVDVPGSSLECVVITRLPFSVPSDPVNAARIRFLERTGGNAFTEYQLPEALIMFKQGFGRLIRTAYDRGVVAILDPRVNTRYYGKRFIQALPACEKTEQIGDVKIFFGNNPRGDSI